MLLKIMSLIVLLYSLYKIFMVAKVRYEYPVVKATIKGYIDFPEELTDEAIENLADTPFGIVYSYEEEESKEKKESLFYSYLTLTETGKEKIQKRVGKRVKVVLMEDLGKACQLSSLNLYYVVLLGLLTVSFLICFRF